MELPLDRPSATYRFDVFISYRRSDGAALAKFLQTRLQSLRFSRSFRRQLTLHGARVAPPRLRVFLDTAYERAAEDFLTQKVMKALDASRWLLVISTPDAHLPLETPRGPEPNWLCHEIDYFLKSRGEAGWRQVLLVLGPNGSPDRFPGRLRELPRWDWVDLRDFRARLFFSDSADAALAKLAGSLVDIPDILLPALRRDLQQRRLAILIAVTLLSLTLAASMTALATFAFHQRSLAAQRLSDVLRQRALSLAANADLRLAQGDGTLATLTALEAFNASTPSSNDSSPAAAAAALYRAVAQSRERQVLSVAPCAPMSLLYNRSGTRLLTGCFSGSLPATPRLIEMPSGKVLAQYPDDGGRVDRALFSPDEQYVATAAQRYAKLWETGTGRYLHTYPSDGHVQALAFDPAGERLLTAADDGIATVWNLSNAQSLMHFVHRKGELRSAQFDRRAERVLISSLNDAAGVLWSLASGARLQTLAEPGAQRASFFDQDRAILTIGAQSGSLWRQTGRRYVKFATLAGHSNSILSSAISPDEQHAATCSSDGSALLWNLRTGKLDAKLGLPDSLVCYAVTFSPDSRFIAIGDDRGVRTWSIPNGQLQYSLITQDRTVTQLAYAPDGLTLLSGINEGRLSVWNLTPRPAQLGAALMGDFHDAEWDPDGNRLLVVQNDGHLRTLTPEGVPDDEPKFGAPDLKTLYAIPQHGYLQQLNDGSLLRVSNATRTALVAGSTTTFGTLSFSAGRARLAAVAGPDIYIWQLANPSVGPVVIHSGLPKITGLALDDTGARLAVGGDAKLGVWDTATTKPVWSRAAHAANIDVLRFSHDGAHLFSASDDSSFRLWDAAGSKLLCMQERDDPVDSVDFDATGNRFAVGTTLAMFYIYDYASEACTQLHQLKQATGFFIDQTLRFTASGHRLLTSGSNGIARLWDVDTGTLLQLFDNSSTGNGESSADEDALSLAFLNLREDRLYLAGEHRASVWKVLPETHALVQYAKDVVPRTLSAEERGELGLDHKSAQ